MNFTRLRQLAFTVTLLSTLAFVFPISAQDTTQPPRSITVIGEGTVSTPPNVATIVLGVELVNSDLTTAFQQATVTMNNINVTLQNLGIDAGNIQATGLNVVPQDQLDAQGNPVGPRTYRVSNSFRVRIRDLSLVETMLFSAVSAGANTISSLSYSYRDPESLLTRARTRAIANAQMHAQQFATELGLTLGSPISASDVSKDSPHVLVADSALVGVDGNQLVSQGTVDATVIVQVTYSIG